MESIIENIDTLSLALPYVEHYGSFCEMHNVKLEGKKTVRIPLTKNSNVRECLENGKYKDMLPNDKYVSTFFLIRKGDIKNGGNLGSRKRDIWKIKGNFKVIGWINCEKLGYSNTEIAEKIGYDYIKNVILKLDKTQTNISNIKTEWNRLSTDIPSELSSFSMMMPKHWNLHPYSFISIDFSIEYLTNCLPDFFPIEEPQCVEFPNSEPTPE